MSRGQSYAPTTCLGNKHPKLNNKVAILSLALCIDAGWWLALPTGWGVPDGGEEASRGVASCLRLNNFEASWRCCCRHRHRGPNLLFARSLPLRLQRQANPFSRTPSHSTQLFSTFYVHATYPVDVGVLGTGPVFPKSRRSNRTGRLINTDDFYGFKN